MNHFLSLRDYEQFIYTIQLAYPSIKNSTLVVAPRGADVVIVRGELVFHSHVRLLADLARPFVYSSRKAMTMWYTMDKYWHSVGGNHGTIDTRSCAAP